MHPRVGAIDNIDVPAVIHFDVIRLDRNLAALIHTRSNTTSIRVAGHRRNVIPDFLGLQRIAYVERADTSVEMSDEKYASVIDRREILIRGMRAEAPSAI